MHLSLAGLAEFRRRAGSRRAARRCRSNSISPKTAGRSTSSGWRRRSRRAPGRCSSTRPSNPTGWAATRETLAAILEIARRHGIWIIADEIYAKFWYGEGDRAPSFLDIQAPDDRILYVNSFSKNWAMTGWRVGWIKAPPALMPVLENLVQYSTSGVPQFMQRGAVAALDKGDDFIASQVARAAEALDLVTKGLSATGKVRFARPGGAFYLFFSIDGVDRQHGERDPHRRRDRCRPCPGSRVRRGRRGFFRLCFNRDLGQIAEATGRLAAFISESF
jgi:aspartate/methionine/tyrosine aminotransferase